MSDSAMQTMYRDEYIEAYEKGMAVTRHTVTTEYMNKGGAAVFLVSGSGGATAVTRGANGKIPSRASDHNQYTATMKEWHDKPIETSFNIFKSQGDRRRIMQDSSRKVMNRRIDDDIHTALDTATVTWNGGAAAAVNLANITTAWSTLMSNDVGEDDVFALITPGYFGAMHALPEFASRDYVPLEPFKGMSRNKAFNWWGVNWIVDTDLPGKQTNLATCFMYGKTAIGHAVDTDNLSVHIGYDEEDDYSFARTTCFMASKLLQNSGIVKMHFDDTAYYVS